MLECFEGHPVIVHLPGNRAGPIMCPRKYGTSTGHLGTSPDHPQATSEMFWNEFLTSHNT